MKAKLYRYITYKQSHCYVDKLQDLVKNYNATYHRTNGMAPVKETKADETNLWWRMYWPKKTPVIVKTKSVRKAFKLKIGDHVRISHLRNIFTREYDEKWSGEIFLVSERRLRGGIPIYRLKDYLNEDIKGTFYQPELQKVELRESDVFREIEFNKSKIPQNEFKTNVEKTLKTKRRERNKQYFVKWLHWPSKFNSWINAGNIQTFS